MATARRQLGYVSSLTTQTSFVQTYGTATGGSSSSITVSGQAYTLLTFTSTGTLTVTKAGLFDFLIVGGGGNGGSTAGGASYSGGGGGGGILITTGYLSANATVTIGAGGAGRIGFSGSASLIDDTTSRWASVGGGQGCGTTAGSDRFIAFTGGSGGGGMGTGNSNFTQYAPAMGGVIGNRGGNGVTVDNNAGGGGGGGSAVGGDGSGTVGGNGGAGYDASAWRGESASTTIYSGGGGGGGASGGTGGTGGGANRGSNGSANTGGGGGGNTSLGGSGGAGGSGIVLVRFKV